MKRYLTTLLILLLLAGSLVSFTGCEPALPLYPDQISNAKKYVRIGDTLDEIQRVLGKWDTDTDSALYYIAHNLTISVRDDVATGFSIDADGSGIITYRHVMVGEHESNLLFYFEKLFQLDENTYVASFIDTEEVAFGEGEILIVYTVESEKVVSITITGN